MEEITKSETSPTRSKDALGSFLKEVRCAVRFPLSLPVELSDHLNELPGTTRNVSANGVLFELEGPLNVGEDIQFSLRMPGSVLGTPQDVLVRCRGRVVRCSISQSHYQAAATIDEYRFVEQ
jgi:PilZ domain